MTRLLVTTLARTAPARLARPSAAIVLALVLAYGCGLWLTVAHGLEGGHERGEPGLAVHWLRDATLALPLVLGAVWAGILVARRLIARAGAGCPAALAAAVLAAVTATAASAALALTGPLHAGLFAAGHGGHPLPQPLHAGRDALLALVAAFPLAALASAALLRRRPWAVPDVSGWLAAAARPRTRAAVAAAVAVTVAAPLAVLAASGADLATAALSPGQPCAADAPVKRFAVKAIDVDITLNRFGDHDPQGKMYVLADREDDVRAQERSGKVSIGLGDDPIQPLVIRANQGDCVEIEFTNGASGGPFGMHIDGLSYDAGSSGDQVGANAPSAVPRDQTRVYRYHVPDDPAVEGTHYIRPGPGNRQAVAHGLFGALVVEPPGSSYRHPTTGEPLASGWEATIEPARGKAFREGVRLYHEIGDEKYPIPDGKGGTLPTVDPITTSYRPGSRAINYRSEPFMHRLERDHDQKSLAYNSYTFGDPAMPIQRGYVGDPTKNRILHAGSETFHVYHMHGGGIRWRLDPLSDRSWSYADTGLDKQPKPAESSRIDSQTFGPGESYTLEIEGGAGGAQQTVGDLLEHCHIAEHYVSGMWSFWRVFNTLQAELRPLPDRGEPSRAVDSAGLLTAGRAGKVMPDGTRITDAETLDDWIRPQLPPPGEPRDAQDASVWNWRIEGAGGERPVYLGEPEDRGPWPDLRDGPHPGGLPGDEYVGDRPKILFNPDDGRPAFPLLRPQIGRRAPHAPNGHSGAPFLGERGGAAPRRSGQPDPYANRRDGLCPASSPVRRFNLSEIELPIPVSGRNGGGTDPTGAIYALNQDKAALRAGTKAPEPLTLRANQGDCVALTLTSEMTDGNAFGGFAKSNLHVHHVQFDIQGSDGASAGLVYDQSVRPYRAADPRLDLDAAAGDDTLALRSVAKFQPGAWIGVGLGTDDIEVRQVASVEPAPGPDPSGRVTLTEPLERSHPAGRWAGTEFVQARWYPDVALDNVFFHNHVDGIHGWGKGLVGQFIVEPPGSTYHDPRTGEEIESGTVADIHTDSPLAPGRVEGAFRELALMTIDDNPVTDSTLNLRAEPLNDRLEANPDASVLFSSFAHGDPRTPLPRAYAGDPFVLRTLNVSGDEADTLRLQGHRFTTENRQLGPNGEPAAKLLDTLRFGVSDRFTAILEGGAGGPRRTTGDFLYANGLGRRVRHGAWGLLRVLGGRVPDLRPLPGREPGAGDAGGGQRTGGRPPAATSAGDPCPSGAPTRRFPVSAVDVPGLVDGRTSAFVPSAEAAAVRSGALRPEPLALHVAAGECVEVRLRNERAAARASFSAGELLRDPDSSGVNAGFNREQTVAPGDSRTYRLYADTARIGSATIADFGAEDSGAEGLYGAVLVAPRGATFTDPVTGLPRDVGTEVDVHVPGTRGYRDFTLLFAEDDPDIGQNTMPYPVEVNGPAFVNYRSSPARDDRGAAFARPVTPLLRAYAGDAVKVHAIGAPGGEQPHVLSLGGLTWRRDPEAWRSQELASQGFGPWEAIDAELVGGAGGRAGAVGDFFYGDLRRPFTQAGMWGAMRVLRGPACAPIRPLDGTGLDCPLPPPGDGTPPPPPPAAPPADGGDDDPVGDRPHRRGRLDLPRRVPLAAVAGGGLPLRGRAPEGARALRLRLLRRVPSPGRRRPPALRLVATGQVAVRSGRPLRIDWRLSRAGRRRLRPGPHVLAATPVPAGAGGDRLEAVTTLTR